MWRLEAVHRNRVSVTTEFWTNFALNNHRFLQGWKIEGKTLPHRAVLPGMQFTLAGIMGKPSSYYVVPAIRMFFVVFNYMWVSRKRRPSSPPNSRVFCARSPIMLHSYRGEWSTRYYRCLFGEMDPHDNRVQEWVAVWTFSNHKFLCIAAI